MTAINYHGKLKGTAQVLEALYAIPKNQQLAAKQLYMQSCSMESFPIDIIYLFPNLELLNLSYNRMSSIPYQIYLLENLEYLFVGRCLVSLPHSLTKLKKLKIVDFVFHENHEPRNEKLPLNNRYSLFYRRIEYFETSRKLANFLLTLRYKRAAYLLNKVPKDVVKIIAKIVAQTRDTA